MRYKIDEFRNIFADLGLHVLCISESWLNANISSNSIALPGFTLHRKDREGRTGGGVAVFVAEALGSRLIKKSSGPLIDFVCVEVSNGRSSCLIVCVYCPPNVFSLPNVTELADTFADLSSRYENIVVCGDFNVNLQSVSNSSGEFLDFILPFGLELVNAFPTYYRTARPSQLDLFLTNSSDNILFHDQVSPPSFLDHDILFMCYNYQPNPAPITQRSFRNYNNINRELLLARCATLPWNELYYMTEIDDKINHFYRCTSELLEEFAPIQTRSVRPDDIPWFNREIERLIEEREFLYHRYARLRTPQSRASYKRVRNLVTARVRAAKREYFARKFDPSLPPKDLWKNARKYGIHSKNSAECSLEPDELNAYFSSAHTTSVNRPGLSPGSSSNGFSFRNVDCMEVHRAIYGIKSRASGSDGLSPTFVKMLLPCVLHIIVHIFNCCIMTSYFPSMWRHSVVLPVPKVTGPLTPSDYRPISILCFLSKVLERLMCDQLQEHVERNSLLTQWQSGYRVHHSCNTALLKVSDDIRSSLDNGEICYLTLLDFSKAFDSINHINLLTKLSCRFHLVSSAIKLVESFLSYRTQQVKVGDSLSSVSVIGSGVPQGSILGPLLFSLYINDLPEVLHDCNVQMFADDVQLYISRPIGLSEDCACRMNEDLIRVSVWSQENDLKLNPTKCKYMILSRSGVDTSDMPPVALNGIRLECVSKTKNLGIIFNNDLSCCDHVRFILGKVYGALKGLRFSASLLPLETKLLLVKSLVIPFLLSGSLVFPSLDSICHRRITVAFNDVIRFVFGLRGSDHISPFRSSIFGCSLDCYFVRPPHKFIYCGAPSYLSSSLSFLQSSRRTDLLLPRFTTRIGEGSFFVQAVRLWNSLPPDIQRIGSVGVFRKKVFEHLLASDV